MLERPALTDSAIAACLRTGYGRTLARTTFLPLGQDVHAWRYRIDTADGPPCFLKIRRAPIDELSLALPRYLRDSGFAQAVAPLPADDGRLWQRVADYVLVLYPFIDGRTGMAAGLAPCQWEALGAALRRLHASALPSELARSVPREQFTQPARVTSIIHALLSGLHEARITNQTAFGLAAFLSDRRDDIRRMLERTQALGLTLRTTCDTFVLCHADLHINNVLVDPHGELWIVDWDQPLFALPERDLMCVLGPAMRGALHGSPEEAALFRGYGRTEMHARALVYYRFERALQDIAENAEQVYWMPNLGETAQRHAADRLMRSFDPDRQLAEAFRADAQLSDQP